jgi:hypothetical protein
MEEGVQQVEKDHPTKEDFNIQRERQESITSSHLEEESQGGEYSSQEAEAEVEKSSVLLVEKYDTCLGIVLRKNQQTREEITLQKLRKIK